MEYDSFLAPTQAWWVISKKDRVLLTLFAALNPYFALFDRLRE